ncbi:DNA glycosylase [Trichophaea hybrida]|nr:DNA glycosylase [Trichophaea hybrida]
MAPTTRGATSALKTTTNTTKPSLSTLKSSKPTGITKPAKKLSKTPTPSNAHLLSLPSASTPNVTPLRPASLTTTNVPLVLPPQETAVVAYPPNSTNTTASILNDAQAHLISCAPSLSALIKKHPCNLFTAAGLSEAIDPFESLTSALISQQITGAAAKSIKAKFISLFSDELSQLGITFPTPGMVLATDIPTLRTAGLSQRKAEYIRSLCEAFESGDVSAEFFAAAGDQEVIERLTKVRGIGVWSAEMFLMFGLKRMDVFSTGDLGIQRGIAAFMGKNVKALKTSGKGKWKYMGENEMLEISEKFRPYRSLFCWYMWRFEGTDVEAMTETKKSKSKAKPKSKAE